MTSDLKAQIFAVSDLEYVHEGVVQKLAENLAPDEQVEAAFVCDTKTFFGDRRKTSVFCTSTRVVLISQKMFGLDIEFRQWSSPGLRAIYSKGEIGLRGPSVGWVDFKHLPQPTADSMYRYFRGKGLVDGVAEIHVVVTNDDPAGQLKALNELVTEGVLTRADMERAKDKFLGRSPDQRLSMTRTLRSLHELRQAGVLTDVEFDIKKRDILATTK